MRNPARAELNFFCVRFAMKRGSFGFLSTNRSFLRGSVRLLWQLAALGRIPMRALSPSLMGWLSGSKVRTGDFLKRSKNTSTKGDQYSVRPLVDRPATAKQEPGSLLGLVGASGWVLEWMLATIRDPPCISTSQMAKTLKLACAA